MHPVESVTRHHCEEVLRAAGLLLATEAQWEYAARAGTDEPWSSASSEAWLQQAVNVADLSGRQHDKDAWQTEPRLDDGWVLHAPAGGTRPNPWGFHEMLGNVWEWCRDDFGRYTSPVRSGDGLRRATGSIGIKRGGSFRHLLDHARVSYRGRQPPETSAYWIGVRPARGVDR